MPNKPRLEGSGTAVLSAILSILLVNKGRLRRACKRKDGDGNNVSKFQRTFHDIFPIQKFRSLSLILLIVRMCELWTPRFPGMFKDILNTLLVQSTPVELNVIHTPLVALGSRICSLATIFQAAKIRM